MNIEGIDDLAADMIGAAVTIDVRAATVVKKGAVELKKAMAGEARGAGSSGGRLGADIDFDMPDPLTAEVGATLGDAGSLQFLYLGNSRTGPLIPDPIIAGEREGDVMEKYIGKVAADALR